MTKYIVNFFQKKKYFNYILQFTIAAFLCIFLILPIGRIILKSFLNDGGINLKYFYSLFENAVLLESLVNSLLIGLCTTVLCLLITFPIAIFNSRNSYFAKNLLLGTLLLPMIMPPFVGAIGIQKLFSRFGSLNIFLLNNNIITTPLNWLDSENSLLLTILFQTLHLYPIMYLNIIAVLSNLDPSLEEMSKTLSVSKIRYFKDIMIPLVVPGIFSGSIIVFIWSFTDLGVPLLLGFQKTAPVQIFHMVSSQEPNPAGYSLVVLILLITSTIFCMGKIASKKDKYTMFNKGHSQQTHQKASSFATMCIYFATLCLVFIALIPHAGVFLTSISDRWFMTVLPQSLTGAHYQNIINNSLSFMSIKNSLFYASIATIINIILGIIISYIIIRKKIIFHQVLDIVIMLPLAIPGIIIAFSYVMTFSNTILDPMVNATPLLIIAYSIRRLPYMVRSASAGLQQIHPSLEECALTFGASKLQTLSHILIPLLYANIIAGSLLCFSYAILDVSDSLILAMKDQFYPITKAIYALFLEQGQGEYLACALGIVGMSLLFLCILTSSKIMGNKFGEMFK